MGFDYKDPDFGFFDDVIELASFTYEAWVRNGVWVDESGVARDKYRKTEVRGSLQAYRKTMSYPTTAGVVTSSRDGKFYVRYCVTLDEGDLIRKGQLLYRLTNPSDYDFAGVRNFDIVRLGTTELKQFAFFDEKGEFLSEWS